MSDFIKKMKEKYQRRLQRVNYPVRTNDIEMKELGAGPPPLLPPGPPEQATGTAEVGPPPLLPGPLPGPVQVGALPPPARGRGRGTGRGGRGRTSSGRGGSTRGRGGSTRGQSRGSGRARAVRTVRMTIPNYSDVISDVSDEGDEGMDIDEHDEDFVIQVPASGGASTASTSGTSGRGRSGRGASTSAASTSGRGRGRGGKGRPKVDKSVRGDKLTQARKEAAQKKAKMTNELKKQGMLGNNIIAHQGMPRIRHNPKRRTVVTSTEAAKVGPRTIVNTSAYRSGDHLRAARTTESAVQPPKKKIPKTNAQKQKEYRERLKVSNPEKARKLMDNHNLSERRRYRNQVHQSRLKHGQGTMVSEERRAKKAENKRLVRARRAAAKHPDTTPDPSSGLSALSLNRYVNKCSNAMDQTLPRSPRKRAAALHRILTTSRFRSYMRKMSFKLKRSNKNKAKARKYVSDFWDMYAPIRVSPSKNDSIPLSNGTFTSRRYLLTSLREAHALYALKYPEHMVSLSFFASLRPFDVYLLGQIPHSVCLCIHCNNYEFAYRALRSIYTELPEYSTHILDSTVCHKDTNMCWNNTCSKCCDGKGFMRLVKDVDTSRAKDITIDQWVKKDEQTSKGKDYSRIAREKVFIPDLIQHTLDATVVTQKHHYVRCHQAAAYDYINDLVSSADAKTCTCDDTDSNETEKCWHHTLMLQVDFSENYKMQYQKAVTQAHYHQPGITLFTVAATRQGEQFSASVCSPHNAHTINEVLPYMTQIFEEYITPEIKEVVIFSDGASQHFKSKEMMRSLGWLATKFKVSVHWNFLASYHGKGRSDGIGATLKQSVWKRVKAGTTECMSYLAFSKTAAEVCPNVLTIAWTDELGKRIEKRYNIKKWLQSPILTQKIQHITQFHHFFQEYDITTKQVAPLLKEQVTGLKGVQLHVNGDVSEDEDDGVDGHDEEDDGVEGHAVAEDDGVDKYVREEDEDSEDEDSEDEDFRVIDDTDNLLDDEVVIENADEDDEDEEDDNVDFPEMYDPPSEHDIQTSTPNNSQVGGQVDPDVSRIDETHSQPNQ